MDGSVGDECNEMEKQCIAPHAMHGENWASGCCEHCQKDFKKKTTWQRFCCKACQTTAYELRTGRKLKFVK